MNHVLFNAQKIFPGKIVCVGRNYVEHIEELNNQVPGEPVLFMKPNSAIAPHIRAPKAGGYHFEGEISFLIGDGQPIGVGLGFDFTNRALQSRLKEKGLPWEKAKAFDGAAVFSAFLPFTGDWQQLRMELILNDRLAQSGGVPQMIFKPDALLAEIKKYFSLQDGDIVMTGTPRGVGEYRAGDRFTGRIWDGEKRLIEQSWIVG